ncbi:hypothetical protein [Rhodovibrio salinarum]|uniref:Uncharacterized protein n=1 Tax=Rhodovibrio salinarum TaxID=1087 RepID=A0A934QJT6_9PROT|nr:hypothetical protein [Rhodovibrio salinarum]MBK1698182.1 hypothetical protein [Rhodovibrio salinarum]
MVRPQDLKTLARAGALQAVVVEAVRCHWYIRVRVGHGGCLVCTPDQYPLAFTQLDAAGRFLSDHGIKSWSVDARDWASAPEVQDESQN